MAQKTLIFIEDGSLTYDNRVICEANALVEAGWEVTVISPKYPQDPLYRKVNDKLRAYFYPKPNAQSVLGHLVEHGISLLFGSMLTLWVWLRHGFSVFHACNPMDILWLIALPYKLLGKKFIYDQHDLCPELWLSRSAEANTGFLHRVLVALEAASYRWADIVISTNDTYRDTAMTRGGKEPDDVFVVRNGPDLNRLRSVPVKRDPDRNGDVWIGYLGNMNRQDGVDYLLDAAYEIIKHRQRSDISFVVIGGGPDQQRLAGRCEEMGLGGRATFTGRVSDEEVVARLCACDICVQPDPLNALNDKSTMNKAMEYMALGKPVVAFDLKETRVSCGDAALYATPNDVSNLADTILRLAGDPALRRELGRAGRTRVKQVLSWSHSIPNLLAAYEHAIEEPRLSHHRVPQAVAANRMTTCHETEVSQP